MTTTYRDNVWNCFFWGLVICAVLAIIVYMLG